MEQSTPMNLDSAHESQTQPELEKLASAFDKLDHAGPDG